MAIICTAQWMKLLPEKPLLARLSSMRPARTGVTDPLTRLGPTFTSRQARCAGMHWRDLYLLRDSGAIHELSRGVYRKAEAPETAHTDLLAVAARAPIAVVCLESALALHDLIDDIPQEIRIAVPRGHHAPRFDYPPLSVSRFEPTSFESGVEPFEAAPGEWIRVYSAPRSIVDAIRLRHLVGEIIGLHALRRYLRRKGSRPADVTEFARLLGAERRVRAAIEAVTA